LSVPLNAYPRVAQHLSPEGTVLFGTVIYCQVECVQRFNGVPAVTGGLRERDSRRPAWRPDGRSTGADSPHIDWHRLPARI